MKFSLNVSIGEIADRLTILALKQINLESQILSGPEHNKNARAALENIQKEFIDTNWVYQEALRVIKRSEQFHPSVTNEFVLDLTHKLYGRLEATNKTLWELEDTGRDQINRLSAGTPAGRLSSHVELACTYREIVSQNERRSRIKAEINQLFNDDYGEVKLYHDNE